MAHTKKFRILLLLQVLLVTLRPLTVWSTDTSKTETSKLVGYYSLEEGVITQIECGSADDKAVKVEMSFYDRTGKFVHTELVTMESFGSSIVEPIKFLPQGNAGQYSVSISDSKSLPVCHSLVYKLDNTGKQVHSAFSLESLQPVAGVSGGVYGSTADITTQSQLSNSITLINPNSQAIKLAVNIYSDTGEARNSLSSEFTLAPFETKTTELNISASGYYEIQPRSPEQTYLAFLKRSLRAETKTAKVISALSSTTPTCATGPLRLSPTPGSMNILEITNPSEKSLGLKIEIRNKEGELLETRPIQLNAHATQLASIGEELKKAGAVQARALCDAADADGPILSSLTLGQGPLGEIGFRWGYGSIAPSTSAHEHDQILLLANSRLGAKNTTVQLDWSSKLTQCELNLFEQSGSLYAQNELALIPNCTYLLRLHVQTGPDFFGLGAIHSTTSGANYSADMLRTFRDSNGAVVAIVRVPGVVRSGTQIPAKEKPASHKQENSGSKIDGASAYNHFLRALDYDHAGKFADAIREYQAAIEAFPNYICAQYNLISIYRRLGDAKGQQAVVDALLRLEPENIDVLRFQAQLYSDQGNIEDAKKTYERIFQINPRLVDAYFDLGYIHDVSGDIAKAIQFYEQAINLDSQSIGAHINLGTLLLEKLGQKAEAKKHFELALSAAQSDLLNEGETRAARKIQLATVYVSLEKFDLAETTAQEALKLNANVQGARLLLAEILDKKGDHAKAIELYNEELKLRPNSPAVLNALGWSHQSAGELDDVVAIYERALAISPNYVQVAINLGLVWQKLGALEEAKKQFKHVSDIAPTNPWSWESLAEIANAEGDFAESKKLFEKALSMAPDNAQIHLNFGLMLLKDKQFELAKKEFLKTAELDPQNAWAPNNLGSIAQSQQKYQEALQYYQQAMKLNPKEPQYQSNYETLKSWMDQYRPDEVNGRTP